MTGELAPVRRSQRAASVRDFEQLFAEDKVTSVLCDHHAPTIIRASELQVTMQDQAAGYESKVSVKDKDDYWINI